MPPVRCPSRRKQICCRRRLKGMKLRVFLALLVCCLAGAAAPQRPRPATKPNLPVIATAQYDNARTGANLLETILTPQNVNVGQFGRIAFFPVDGDVYAQPLYVPKLEIPGRGSHNVVFIATEKDSVYAFDADATSTEPLWQVSFVDAKKYISPVSNRDVFCPFIQPDIGITSTPVIDLSSKTLYALARTREAENGKWVFRQKLHALDLVTGAEKLGGPITIRASFQGDKSLFSKGVTEFDPLRENQRAALLLVNNNVFITLASSCDVGPYYGWVMSYDARTLKQTGVLNVSPGAKESGIWQADAGPAADGSGNVYLITGNGKFTAASGGRDYGDSVLKIALTPNGLAVRDYFTPADQEHLNDTDGDFGSGSPILLPDQPAPHSHLLLAAGKSAKLYELDRDNLGHFHAADDSNAVQVVPAGAQSFGAPAYWNGHVWIVSTKVWNGPDQPAVLFAYDASNVSRELYNSTQNPTRDGAGYALRFTIPTIANGRVYVPAKRRIDVFGLLAPAKGEAK